MENNYQLPKFKNEKKYYPFRCLICSNFLRIKLHNEIDRLNLFFSCKCGYMTNISLFEKTKDKRRKFLSYSKSCLFCSQNEVQFKCLNCKKYICSNNKCIDIHKRHHYSKEFTMEEISDYKCKIHLVDNKFIGFCKTCEKDVCSKCIEKEKGHNIILYKDIIPNPEEFIKKYNQIEISSNDLLRYIFNHCGVLMNTKTVINIFVTREILRNIYTNFSRKINQLNFALIYNVIENLNSII